METLRLDIVKLTSLGCKGWCGILIDRLVALSSRNSGRGGAVEILYVPVNFRTEPQEYPLGYLYISKLSMLSIIINHFNRTGFCLLRCSNYFVLLL